jgi:hypothetical protein
MRKGFLHNIDVASDNSAIILMNSSWTWKSRKAVPQRRSSRKGFFSPAEDALKRRMT